VGVARQYRVGPGEIAIAPPARRPGAVVDQHGLTKRHWEVLWLLAELGALDTEQVTMLAFGSRPSASRHLSRLNRGGLVWRFVFDDDPTHVAYYEVSSDGLDALAAYLRREKRPVPAALGKPFRGQDTVNAFYVGLAAQSRRGPGGLLGWRRALDTVAWLRGQGIEKVNPRGSGVWVEDGTAVRFLLHVDKPERDEFGDLSALPPSQALSGYRQAPRGVPASVILVVTDQAVRETALHRELIESPLPVPVAVTTLDRLMWAADASEPIWSLTTADPADPVRLIEIARRATS